MSPTLTWQGKQQPPETYPAISLRLSEIFTGNQAIEISGDREIGNSPIPPSAFRLPPSPYAPNILFHADNLPTLAHLCDHGYRGKVKLIYIDPPYQSGVTWQRKVRLRGAKAVTMQTAADHVIGAQPQYDDRWSEADYLQFIYERLPLLRDLLSDDGSLWLHCDHRQAHHLRCLLEETFGTENFLNTITWRSQTARGAKVNAFYFPSSAHSIHIFAKDRLAPTTWNPPKRTITLTETEAEQHFMRDEGGFFRTSDPGSYRFATLKQLHSEGRLYVPFGGEIIVDEAQERVYGSNGGNLGIKYYLHKVGRKKWQVERAVDNLWDDIPGLGTTPGEDLGYPTQKTEALLTRIIETASNVGDLVLDCFMGSGTTLAVANKLERRWIGIDQNRGALTTTRRRLQAQGAGFVLFEEERGSEGAGEKGSRGDGEQGRWGDKVTRWQGEVTDLGSRIENPTPHSAFRIPHSPNLAPTITLSITRNAADPATIELQIEEYSSPALNVHLARRKRSASANDWRAALDSVEIDPDYNGTVFRCAIADVPLKKSAQVSGTYHFQPPPSAQKIALRVTDVLGEETIIVKKIGDSV